MIRSRLGDPAAALREIDTLPPGELRDEALALLATDRAVHGDEAGTREALGRIGSPGILRRARIRAAFQAPPGAPAPRPRD